MLNRENYIFNPNFQKGTVSTKKTNFGTIQEPDQLLFRRDFFSFPLYFSFLNFYRQISIEKRRSPLTFTGIVRKVMDFGLSTRDMSVFDS